MIKKIILISLICLFLFFCLNITPVLAQTPNLNINSSQNTEIISSGTNNSPSVLGIIDVLDTIWDWLVNTYKTVANFITNSFSFFSNSTPTAIDTKKLNYDYTQEDKNINTRAMPEKIKKYRKGVWFYEVLDPENKGKYKKEDELVESSRSDCPDTIKVVDIIYFYYKNQDKYPKILYERGKMDAPVDYPDDLINSLNVNLNYSDECYINAYDNLPDAPIGWFVVSGDDQSTSFFSTQLNDSVRTIISNNAQGESAPPDVTNEIEARMIAEDTDKQERSMLLHLIPEEEQLTIPCGDDSTKNRNYLRIAYYNTLYPENWARKDYNSGKTMDGLIIEEGGTPTEDETYSMSQHGAHGMSLHAYDYKQILSAYFGDVTTAFKDEGRSDENLKISVFVGTNYGTDSFDSCLKLPSGEKFMPDVEKGEGGFKLVSKHPKVIEACKKGVDYEPILETYIDKETGERKTKETGKFKEKVPGTCMGFIKDLSMTDYLLGIAETPIRWHLEYQKAHIIVCRQHALDSKSGSAISASGEELGEWVYNNSNTQAFRCDQANMGIGSTNNLAMAIKLTDREYVVYENSDEPVPVSERSYFGRQQIKPPFFDGTIYENLSMVKHSGYYKSVTGICFTALKNTLDDDGQLQLTNNSSQSPIINNYDLATIDNGRYLKTYTYNDNQTHTNTQILGVQTHSDKCYLDSRIFSALDSLISSLEQDISDNQIIPNSCYRSLTDQNKLWINGLKTYGNETQAIKHINKPGESPHHTGRVIDFADKNGKLTINSSVYQWLVKNGSRFGFYNLKLEPEHWVYNP